MTDTLTESADTFGQPLNRRAKRNGQSGTDCLPPHSVEMEQGVIGCVLWSPAVCMEQLEEKRFAAAEFYDLRHQTIFHALQKLRAAKTGEIDLILLQQTLKDMGMLEEIGGIPYLNVLQDAVPSAANLAYYLDIVREKAKLRKLIQFGAEIVDRAFIYEGEISKLLDQVEHDLLAFTEPIAERTENHVKTVITQKVLPMIERHYNRGSTQLDGLPTGKDWYLDKIILGIASNDYVILAGRPGEGKTSFALNIVDYLATDYVWYEEITRERYDELIARNIPHLRHQEADEENPEKWFQSHKGIPIGVFTLEMTEESLVCRLVFGRAQVSSGQFRQGFASKEMWNKVHKAVGELSRTNIYLDEEPDQTIDQIAAKARRWARQYGIKLFVLDYLQLLDGDNERDNDRVRALRKISKKIVALKKRLGIPWLVLAQMNRNIETAERARRPVMSDLKESGSLEQDADKIIILYHPLKTEGIEEDEDLIDAALRSKFPDGVPWDAIPRRINALVVKNRNGPTGPAAFLFQNNQCLFHDWRQWKIANGIESAAKGERQPDLDRTISDEDVPKHQPEEET